MLVWTDLETTGLDPKIESILEVAVIVTDDALKEVARFERVIYYSESTQLAHLTGDESDEEIKRCADFTKIHPIVVRMHAKNGLWKASDSSELVSYTVDSQLAEFLREHSVLVEKKDDGTERKIPAQLAGSTISFDRGFMAEELPQSLAVLHYRNVDVTTLNELARRFWPAIHKTRPKDSHASHRGMSDIEESIDVLRHYLAHLAPQNQLALELLDSVTDADIAALPDEVREARLRYQFPSEVIP